MKIFVLNSWIRNKGIPQDYEDSNYLFLVYLGLRIIMSQQKQDSNVYYVSVENIIAALFGEYKSSPKLRRGIIGEINYLIYINKIGIDKLINGRDTKWNLDLSGLYFNSDEYKGRYTILELDDIRKILNLPNKNKISILRYYTVLVSTMISGVGEQSLETIRTMIDVGKTMQISYNKVLEENEIIYIHRSNAYQQNSKGELKTVKNIYGLMSKKDAVDKKANRLINQLIKNNKNGIIRARSNANKIRSIRQKINKHSLLNIDDVTIIINENRVQKQILKKETDKDIKNMIIKNIISIDIMNENIIPEKVRKELFIKLKDRIQDIGESLFISGESGLLYNTVYKVLGPKRKACELQEEDIEEIIKLYYELADVYENNIHSPTQVINNAVH